MRFRSRARKTALSVMFGHNARDSSVRVSIELDKAQHAGIVALLHATGETFVEDAVMVLLTSVAASDNHHVFALSERGRALIGTFRDMLGMLTREHMEAYRAETERQLNEFINTIHASEETQ